MKNLLVNRAVSTAKKNFNLRWLLVPILLIILGVGYVWGAEGDTYDFSQTLSQVLNNGAAIADVTVAEQTYTVKEVNVTVNYNKSRPGATVSVKVGGVTFGSPQTINSNKTTTFTFTGASAVKGQVVVSSTNNCTSSSGNGTFKITNVRLVEGATGSTKTLSSAVSPVESGSVELGKTSLAPDESTTATATANDGYEFSSWEISGTGASLSNASTNPTTVTMGSADATVTANFSCVTPAFSTNLSTTPVNYTTGASASALTVAASANNASITYLWQSSTNGSSWSSASGTNNTANYTPSTASAGTMYYRCIATNAASGCSTSATSNVATIIVSAPTPATITLQNYDGDATTTGYYSGGSFTLPSENDFVCGDLTFVGWSSVTIDNSATKPSAATYHEPGESVTLGASNTFYAVFANASGGGGASKTYSFTITGTDIPAPTGGGYQTGSTTSTATATDASGSTMDVEWSYANLIRSTTSGYQGYIQFRNSPGYLYNTTDLGAISSIVISDASNVASFRGTSENPTTDSGKSDGYFRVARSSGTGYAQNITITFTKTTGGGTTYSNYTTNCVNMRTVYLDAYHFGDSDGAQFAIYSWKNSSDDNKLSETFMTKVTDCYYEHLYEGEMPDNHDRVIFLRNASAATSPVKEGANKLNQTVDITTDGDKDFFTIASGGEGNTYNGSWSVYTPHYTVTFDKNGAGTTDSWPSDQCIAEGEKVTDPNITPLAMGKTFVGWYQEAEGVNAWVFNTNTVSAATTIYAKWNDVATKTIYLDASATLYGDKTWDADNTVLFVRAYINGTSIGTNVKATSAISSCQPHVYQFVIPGNATHVSFARCATGTTELPAEWANPPVYNSIKGKTVESGKDHYRVTDWGSATLESSPFTPVSYTISYNAGTSGSGSRESESKACGVAFTLPNTQVFTRNGYTMDGWATSDGGDKVYYLGESYTTDANLNLYPHWTEATYSVTLTTNGGTINAGNVTSYTYGTGATLPADVTKAHATFQGWYASSTCEGERVYSIGASEFGDKTYWAKWEAITYTVTWKANGSIVRTDSNVAEGGKVASVPSAPADLTTDPNGCDAEFAGWVIETNDPGALSISSQTSAPAGLFTDVAGSPTITGNVTFVAIYRQEQ